jgi:hypothetical protein
MFVFLIGVQHALTLHVVFCAALQVRINYANPDMVGHTGDLKACMQACATVDKCLADLLAVCDEVGGRFLVTSDHGNSDDMVQREKKTNKPLMDVDSGGHGRLSAGWAAAVRSVAERGCLICQTAFQSDRILEPWHSESTELSSKPVCRKLLLLWLSDMCCTIMDAFLYALGGL